jgi:putative salt-induced outer membrane protein YdiY
MMIIGGLLTLGLGWSGVSQAQIVNVLSEDEKDAKGFTGSVGVALERKTGNVVETELEAEAGLQYHWDSSLVMLILRTKYGSEAGNVSEKANFEHLRFRQTVMGPLGYEVFVQQEGDISRRLVNRAVGGAGLRMNLADWDGGDLYLGVAYMAEQETLDDADGASDADETFLRHRNSSYVALTAALTKRIQLNETIYFQPRFDAFDQFRIMSETGFEFKVEEQFSVVLSYTVRHDAAPHEQLEATDTELQTELQWSF